MVIAKLKDYSWSFIVWKTNALLSEQCAQRAAIKALFVLFAFYVT